MNSVYVTERSDREGVEDSLRNLRPAEGPRTHIGLRGNYTYAQTNTYTNAVSAALGAMAASARAAHALPSYLNGAVHQSKEHAYAGSNYPSVVTYI